MVDVEQGGLGALEQDVLAVGVGAVEQMGGFGHVRADDLGVGKVLLADLVDRVAGHAVDLGEDLVLFSQGRFELLTEDLLVEQVLHADADAGELVLVAGADAATGGADLVLAQALFGSAVEVDVVGHDDVGVAGDDQTFAGDALGFELGHFIDEHARVDHHAVADDGRDRVVHDARGDKVQGELLVAVNHRMAGVVAALVAYDVIEVLRNEVGDLALAFIAPLGADEHGTGHMSHPFIARSARAQGADFFETRRL